MVRHQSRTLDQRKGTSANQQGSLTQERRTQKPHPIRMKTRQFDTGYAHTEKAGDPKEKHSNVRCLAYEEFRTAKAVTNQVENLSSELWEAGYFISSLTSLKHFTMKSISSFVWLAHTCVRILAFPFGTTG